MQRRAMWVDYARAIAIIMIVIGHANAPAKCVKFLYAFHVQTFLVLSGMFINTNQSFASFVKKRIKRLLIPYLVAHIALNAIAVLWFDSQITLKNMVMELLYCQGNYGHWFVTPLWFLAALFVSQIVVFVFEKYTTSLNRKERIFLSFIMVLIYFSFQNQIPRLPFMLDLTFVLHFFLLIGKEYKEEIMSFSVTVKQLIFILLTLVLTISLNGYVNTAIRSFANPINYLLASLLGAGFIIGLSHLMEEKEIRPLLFLGNHSLLVCIIHPIGFAIAGKIYENYLPYIYIYI